MVWALYKNIRLLAQTDSVLEELSALISMMDVLNMTGMVLDKTGLVLYMTETLSTTPVRQRLLWGKWALNLGPWSGHS